MGSNTGNVTGAGDGLPLPPPRERATRKGPLPRPGIEIGGSEQRATKAAQNAGMPAQGPGQEKPIPAPRPAPLREEASQIVPSLTDYHQERIPEEKRKLIHNLRGYILTHPECMAVEGIARLPGEGPVVRKLLENVNVSRATLAEEQQPGTDFFHSVAAALIKAFDGLRPFSADGYHLMLQAGDKTRFPNEENRAYKLKQAIDELPATDQRVLKGLVDFMIETEKAQKVLPADKSMDIQKIAMAVAPNLTANTDLRLLIKHTSQMREALVLLAKQREFVFEGKPFKSTESTATLKSRPRGIRKDDLDVQSQG